MTYGALFHRATLLITLAVATAAPARADAPSALTAPAAPAPPPLPATQAALRKLRDTLAFDGDPRAIVDARIQIDALLARPEPAPDTAAQALRSLTGRVDAALAARAAAPNLPVPGALPVPGLAWWRETGGSLAPLALVAVLACVAALLASVMHMVVGRRLLAAGTTAQAAVQAGGKLFESAARRFMQAQDESGASTDNALAAATQAGHAAARLTAAARDTEARLRATLDDAQGRLRATLAHAETRLRDVAEATESRLQACLEQAEGRLLGVNALAQDIQHAADALPDMLAQAVGAITGPGVSAIEDASALLRESTQAVTVQLAAEARELPPLLADAILAVAARGLPAIEAATGHLASRAEEVARAATAIEAAGAGLEAARADWSIRDLLKEHALAASAQAGELARIAATTMANAERAAVCLDGLQAAVLAASSAPAPDAGLVARIDATLADARLARAEDAAGAALLMEALSARADAALGLLPVQADALAAAAAQLRADAGDVHAVLAAALLTDVPAATQALVSAGAVLADQGKEFAGAASEAVSSAARQAAVAMHEASLGQRRRDAAFADMARQAAASMQANAALLQDCTIAAVTRLESPDTAGQAQMSRLAGLLDDQDRRVSRYLADEARVAAAPPQESEPATRLVALEGAIAHVQNAAARVLQGAGAQELASERVAEAARQVAACFAVPAVAATPPMSLARLNGLAAEADILHAQADLLATAALRGDGRDLPSSLPHETPALLAAIEASIKGLRGTATALALASDAVRAAA